MIVDSKLFREATGLNAHDVFLYPKLAFFRHCLDFEFVEKALANIGSISDLFGNQDAKAIAIFLGGDKEFLQWQK